MNAALFGHVKWWQRLLQQTRLHQPASRAAEPHSSASADYKHSLMMRDARSRDGSRASRRVFYNALPKNCTTCRHG